MNYFPVAMMKCYGQGSLIKEVSFVSWLPRVRVHYNGEGGMMAGSKEVMGV